MWVAFKRLARLDGFGSGLSYSAKCSLVGLLFAIPLFLLGFFFLKEIQRGIWVAESERSGVKAFEKLIEIRRHAILMSADSQQDTNTSTSHLVIIRSEINALRALQPSLFTRVLTDADIDSLLSELGNQEGSAPGPRWFSKLNEVATKTLNSSQLALDPEVASYYLMSAQSFQLRQVLASLTDLQTLLSETEGSSISRQIVGRSLEQAWTHAQADYAESFKANPEISTQLSEKILESEQAIQRLTTSGTSQTVTSADVSQAVNKVSDLSQATLDTLDSLLVDRAHEFQSRRQMVLSLSAIFLLLAVAGLVRLYFSTLGQLRHSIRQAQRIAQGDFTVVRSETARDEFGKLAKDFTDLAQGLEKTSNIAEQIANGDLSTQFVPRSKDDQLGHSLMRMQENLRSLVYDLVMGVNQLELAAEKVNLSVSETEDVSSRVVRMMTSLHGECDAITKNVSEASTYFNHHLELTEKCQKFQLQSLEALEDSSNLFEDVSVTAVRLKEVMTRMEIALQVQAQTGTGRGGGVEKLQANWDKTQELIFDLLRGYYQLEQYVRELRLQLSHSADVMGEAFSHRDAKILEFESSIATVETMVAAIQEIQAEMLQLRDSNAHLNEVNQAISVASSCLRDGVGRFKLHGDRASAFEISEAFLLEDSA